MSTDVQGRSVVGFPATRHVRFQRSGGLLIWYPPFSILEENKKARPPRAAGAHEAYTGPDGSIHCVNEARMYVPSVECTSVVHVVMLSLKSAGEGADSKFVPRRGVRSRTRARRAGQARELTSGFRARTTQHMVSHACARASK